MTRRAKVALADTPAQDQFRVFSRLKGNFALKDRFVRDRLLDHSSSVPGLRRPV
jgi:hypothetical protein